MASKKKNFTLTIDVRKRLDERVVKLMGDNTFDLISEGNLISNLLFWAVTNIPDIKLKEAVIVAKQAAEFYKMKQKSDKVPESYKTKLIPLPIQNKPIPLDGLWKNGK